MEERTINTAVAENATDNNQEEQKLKILSRVPASFDPCQEVKVTSTRELAKSINGMFSLFEDYAACNLVVQPLMNAGNILVPILYFHLLPRDTYKKDNLNFAFKPIDAIKDEEPFVEKLSRISGTQAGNIKNTVRMTKDGMDVMEDFMAINRKPGQEIKWVDFYQVKQLPDETLIAITGIDMYKILSKIYGEVDSEGKRYEYKIFPVNEVGGRAVGSVTNWNITIYRLRLAALSRAADVIGLTMPVDYGMPPMFKRDGFEFNHQSQDPFARMIMR